jgi:hypothetical protein
MTKHTHPITTLPPDYFDGSPTHAPENRLKGLAAASVAILTAGLILVLILL